MIKIAPSVLSADFAILGEEIAKVEPVADLLHLDVMDGHFVPNLTIGPMVVEAIRRRTRVPLDVHLMIQNPERYIGAFAQAGATYLTVHAEVCPHLHRTIQQIREAGIKAGVALNPSTSLHAVENILDQVDLVLIMSVNPGFGGQSFIPFVLKKIEELARRLHNVTPRPELEVDGGIKLDNCHDVAKAGATILVAGSAIFHAPDPRAAVLKMKEQVA
ncbi:MAG TPA: ribulose-phosphate 3-epimerase [Candidatus Methylomirabilis sp.]|nr:ribulose-phosphate 3-epimerase [Candidatus Methylomirabilis sp.]